MCIYGSRRNGSIPKPFNAIYSLFVSSAMLLWLSERGKHGFSLWTFWSNFKYLSKIKLTLDHFQTFYELTNDTPSAVPCQAGFVAPLPSFPFESDPQDQENSLGSTGSSSNSSWQTPPQSTADDALAGPNSSKFCLPETVHCVNYY